MKPVLYEILHRYVFDNIYVQSHKTTIIDRIVLFFYNKYYRFNWRYELHQYVKSIRRYSDYDRRDLTQTHR